MAVQSHIATPSMSQPRIGFFTSTIRGNRVAETRLAHLKQDLNATSISLFAFDAVTHGNPQQRQYAHIRNLMRQAAKNPDIDVAIVADDDFKAAPNFEANLAHAMRAIPDGWRMLHLCPGWRWGRARRGQSITYAIQRLLAANKIVRWDAGFLPSVPTTALRLDATRRLIVNLPELARTRRLRQVGGPIAFAARRASLPAVVKAYDAAWRASNRSVNNDVLLLNISAGAGAADYVAYEPLLCVEDERGGSLYPRKSKDWVGQAIERARDRRIRELEKHQQQSQHS